MPSEDNTTPAQQDDEIYTVKDRIYYRKSPDEDDMGYKAVLESLTNPQSYLNFRSALRATVFVAFPLFTLGVHPNTMFKVGFIAVLISAVLSTSTCRATLGEQIGLHTWTWRGMLYMFIFSEAAVSFNLEWHPHQWWGLIAAGIFIASFTSDANIRRFMYLYFFLFMMEIREFVLFVPYLPPNNGRWMTADFMIGTCLGIASNLLPYPALLSTIVDTLAGKLFSAVAKNIFMMHKFVWSEDMHAGALFFNDKSIFDMVEHWLGLMPTLLWFTNWEPLEFAIRNPIRRLKFSFLRRILSLVYAAFSTGNTLVKLKREQSDRMALQRVRQTMWAKAFKIPSISSPVATGSATSPVFRKVSLPPSNPDVSHAEEHTSPSMQHASVNAPLSAEVQFSQALSRQFGEAKASELFTEMWTLRQNSKEHSVKQVTNVMNAIIGIATSPCTPEGVLSNVAFEEVRKSDTEMRRNIRMEVLQTITRQKELIEKRRKEHENSTPVFGSPNGFESIAQFQRIIDDTEVFIQLNTIFFHMLLSMIAGEVYSFGEQMKDYQPAKPLGRRLLDHFIVEPWHDFWEEVWFHITLARPADWRILKDAIKITCAYLAACAMNFEMYVMPGGTYYFGTTILLGLPVEEESLSLGVNRLAGNALGCSLGFLAYNNFHSLQSIIGMSMFFIFLCQLFKNHPIYGQTFFYASIMVMGGVATSLVPIDLLTRLIASSYTVCAYLLCCLLIFPTSPMKILWGYRAKLNKLLSEIIDQAAYTAHSSLEEINGESTPAGTQPEVGGHQPYGGKPTKPNEMVAYGRSGELCADLSNQLFLARRLLAMCTKWTPFAARQHVIRGMLPFPEVASKKVHQCQIRLLAELDLLVFGAQLLHRPRHGQPMAKPFVRLISGSLSDFLYEFSHSCRAVLQDMIDSTQLSREWNYELYLRRCGRLSRLKVAAHAVMYECYVLLGDSVSSKSAGSLDDQAFDELRQEMRQTQLSTGLLGTKTSSSPPVVHGCVDMNGSSIHSQAAVPESVADRFLLVRRGDGAVSSHSPLTAQPTTAGNTVLVNKSFHFTAPLMQFSMNPNAASRFQSKDTEENRIDMELVRRSTSFLSNPTTPELTTRNNPLDEDSLHGSHSLTASPSSVNFSHCPWLAFSYHEDATDLPIDTDFMALNAIVAACEGFIAEIEDTCGAVNSVSQYQKQLHESSLMLPLIDKISNKMQAHVQSVYLKRHYNPPVQELNYRGGDSIQNDLYKAWAF